MGTVHKLVLDDFLEDNFELFAIHTTLDLYRVAYFLNRNLKLHLKYKQDIDSFELFEYENEQQQSIWNLVSNTGERIVTNNTTDTLIFEPETTRIRTYLIPEHKNIDCFLKIENCQHNNNIISKISKIPGVITAFVINANQLKSKNNLIFH